MSVVALATYSDIWKSGASVAGVAYGDGRVRLGYMTVEDVDHGWIGGNSGKYSTPAAANVSELIWAFSVVPTRMHWPPIR